MPPSWTRFDFVRLPPEAATPLATGITYTLTVSAYGSSTNGGVLQFSENYFRDVTTYLQSVGTLERGIDVVSSVSFDVTTL